MAEKKVLPTDPFSEKETVFLPRASAGESKFQYVSVNGRSYLVPKGEAVEVPKPIAEVLRNAQAMQAQAEQYEQAQAGDHSIGQY